jgi:hypothetical protein
MRTGCWRKLLMVPLAVLLTVGSSQGQRKLNFRIFEFGAGPAVVGIQDNDALIQRQFKPSVAASAGLVYSLKRKLAFTTHVMYELKGGKAIQYFEDSELPPVFHNTNASYISFIPGIRRYLGNSSVFIEGGPYVAFLITAGTRRTANGVEQRWGNPYTAFDAGLSASIGVTPMRQQLKGFSMRLVNNLGLADIDHHSGTKEWNNSLSLIVGMRIKMN